MSYVFDVLERVFTDEIAPSVKDKTLKILFDLVLLSMHGANHRADDVINKDINVSRAVSELDDYVKRRTP